MLDNFIKLIIGDLDEKREYKQMIKRVDALPKDYSFAFKKIQKYMYSVGAPGGNMTIFTDMIMFTDLVDLFEASAIDGRQVIDVIGSDVDKFCDEFMSAYITNSETLREKLNKEIMEKFNKEGR
jgi:DNA-binding ferritin-like protein (Dps family)